MLGLLGSASVMASNVYSINAVGYINVTLPPGYSIVTCPLICSPDNTVPTLFPDSNSTYDGSTVLAFNNGAGFGVNETANFGSWSTGGPPSVTINPGQAVFFYNSADPRGGASGNLYATFVGTVPVTGGPAVPQLPSGLSVSIVPGYNLIGSVVPFSGDLNTGTIPNNFGPAGAGSGDSILFYDTDVNPSLPPTYQVGYGGVGDTMTYNFGSWSGGNGPGGDPLTTSVTQGWFYYNANSTYTWTETFSIN